VERSRHPNLTLAETLENLRENQEFLVDTSSWLNPISIELGERIRRAGVKEALHMIEFCCKQANRIGNKGNEDWTFFHDYRTMLLNGYLPSLIETLIRLEVDCDVRAMKEAKLTPPPKAHPKPGK
jgi:hypothetical protein